MKISLKWLNDHIDVADYVSRPEELAKILTSAGLEVEAVENHAKSFANIVVGQVVNLARHPNADRLTVCQVDTGEGEPRQIVCGAKNHREGDKVVVTLPGAVLPGNFEIKKSKIRDVESLGMMASESELGLKKESEGIMILPEDAPVGKPFAEYFGIDDVILELNVTPNRADCLSHLGLARELSALLDRPLKARTVQLRTSDHVRTQEFISLEVREACLCPRYAGRLIKGVRVGASPAWLKTRLESVGLNSINNIVDATNFIMMDLGQPLHAFDVSQLSGHKVIVDRAVAGEKFITLDGRELTLTGDELTIRDRDRAVCLAGAIGGQNSGISQSTTDVFIESAHFAMDSVRRTARRHGLQTDSAYRFSRGTDPSGVMRALDRACALIQEITAGDVAGDYWDLYSRPQRVRQIATSATYAGERLGYPIADADFEKWLKRLGCVVERAPDGGVVVTPPDYRMDLEQDVDLVEEFSRLNGYDHIPERLPEFSYAPLANDKDYLFETRVSELARAAGLSQSVNYGFVGSKIQASVLGPIDLYRGCGLEMSSSPIALRNPLSEDLDVMRISLLPGLLGNMARNYRHGSRVGRLFETGYVFRHGPDGYQQDPRLGLVNWGVSTGLWQKDENPERVFFDLKGRLQSILEKLQITQVQFKPWQNTPSLVHPAQAAVIFIEGRNVGFISSVHPRWLAGEKIRTGVAVAEIDLRALARGQPRPIKFKPVSKFPSVERDLAFVLPKTLSAQDVAHEIRRTAGALLQSVDVFDVFEGGNLPPDHISVAYRMVFQDLDETLSEERLLDLQSRIIANIEKKLSIKVR
jgi:phenylalanyl-tRNA synthetase beta chain